MEVGPTADYMMGGIRVDPDTGRRPGPGLFAAGEFAAGMHGANRLGGNSLSDLLVFGSAPGRRRRPSARRRRARRSTADTGGPGRAGGAVERDPGEDPYRSTRSSRSTMQRLVGIFRIEADLNEALARLAGLRTRWPGVRVAGGPPTTRAGTSSSSSATCSSSTEAIARSARPRRAAAPTAGSISRVSTRRGRTGTARRPTARHDGHERNDASAVERARTRSRIAGGRDPRPEAHLWVWRGTPIVERDGIVEFGCR